MFKKIPSAGTKADCDAADASTFISTIGYIKAIESSIHYFNNNHFFTWLCYFQVIISPG